MQRLTTPRKLAFTVIATIGIWLIAEACAQMFYKPELDAWAAPPPGGDTDAPVLQGNPYLIYEYPPGSHLQAGVAVRINALGLRGPEIEVPKPEGRRRLLTTGDSSVFGFGVDDASVFSTVVADRLGENVDAVCGATPGYSTVQTLNLMRMRLMATDPDLLIIGNVWSDNNFDSFVDSEVLATYTGWEQSVAGTAKRLLSHSAVFRVADWKLRVRDRASRIRQVGWMVDSGVQDGRRRVDINSYAKNLDTLARIALDSDAEVMFLVLPNNEDLEQQNEANPKAWDPYRDVIRDAAARYGAPVLDMPELFRASGRSVGELFIDQMHPTAIGHRLMADAVAEVLEAADWANGGRIMEEPERGAIPEYEDPFSGGATQTMETPATGVQPATEPAGRAITGTLKAEALSSGRFLLDAYEPGDGQPNVIGGLELKGAGGAFRLAVNKSVETVIFRVYLDLDEDGPDADDETFVFVDTPVKLDEDGAEVEIDLTVEGGELDVD